MTKLSAVVLVLISFALSGCGLKDRYFPSGEDQATEIETFDDEGSAGLTGMLLVLNPDKCPLAEGCGPEFSLLGRNLKTRIAVDGKFQWKHRNLIVTVVGKPKPLSDELRSKSGYENIRSHVNVEKYRLRSKIAYQPFLVEQATAYTTSKLGCDLLWDKSYSWNITNNTPHLMVRMTNTFATEPYPYLELTYNGQSGGLISAVLKPDDIDPCK